MNYFELAKRDIATARAIPKEDTHFNNIMFHYASGVASYIKGFYVRELNELPLCKRTLPIVRKLQKGNILYSSLLSFKLLFLELDDFYFNFQFPSEDSYDLSEQEFNRMVLQAEQLLEYLKVCTTIQLVS